MLSLCVQSTTVYSGACSPSFNPNHDYPRRRLPSQFRLRHRRSNLHVFSIDQNGYFQTNVKVQYDSSKNLRTLFPGGYKRPEIKVPSLVLKLSTDELLKDKTALDKVDEAVAKSSVGVVLLDGGDNSGGRLYEAACLLKSVIRDRAYLVINERVDIAAAIGASGVVLSDQGLPTIVARKTMLDSRSGSVVLPLVARTVQTSSDALRASSAEGADFLIYSIDAQNQADELAKSVLNSVNVPIFVAGASFGVDILHSEGAKLLKEGASGFVVSLLELEFLSGGVLNSLFLSTYPSNKGELPESSDKLKLLDAGNGLPMTKGIAGFSKLEENEKLLLEQEKLVLLEAIDIIRRAAPLMGEVSLLIDAVSQLDEPFLLVIVGEFNSGKSTVINALLGNKYLEDGVVPTTNEIMFLNYSESESTNQQRCERHPDGQLICYLPALILKDMNIVDTPGTNVILQRQQRLTEEFVPRADLLLFIMSADRPLTESEVDFLHYTQKWKKKSVFVLNKSDLYQNASELEEAVSFIKENARKLLNTEDVILYPVSARSALEAKLLASSLDHEDGQQLSTNPDWRVSSFSELEKFLYSFLDGSTDTGIERMKLKLETPIGIAEQLLCACQNLVDQQFEDAKQDLDSIHELIDGVKDYTKNVENESLSWKKQTSSLITSTQERVLKLIQSTLQISNLNLVTTYVFRDTSSPMPVTSRFQDDIVAPAISDAQKLLGEYVAWLESKNSLEKKLYKETLEKRWPSFVDLHGKTQIEAGGLQLVGDYELSINVIRKFSDDVLSKLFEQEIREVFLETFGGLGAAGLSASLLTSVLPTTLEDLLALALCSAGGLLSISNFPTRRQKMVDKVKKVVNSLTIELEDAMQKDLVESSKTVEEFVKVIGKPYQEAAQSRLDKFLETQGKLTDIANKIKTLQVEIQNLHIS